MHTKKNDVDGGDISLDLYPFIRQYKGGRLERFLHSSFVAASEDAAVNRGVATRDVVIDKTTGVSARLFLPSVAAAAAAVTGLPVIMYIHGGSFCTESAFGRTYHNYARSLAVRTRALVVSVEYRLAPEHPVPAAYDDAWAALQWVASLSDPWLFAHADPGRTFLAGDSAGGNIAYNTAVRASRGGDLDIEGLVMVQPYFWGVDRLSSSERVWDGIAMLRPDKIDMLWPFITAGKLGDDDPRMNPVDEDIASLTCQRVLVAVAGKDRLGHRGSRLAARMGDCAWADDGSAVTLVESEGEDHGFHLYHPLRASSKILMESIVHFVNQPTAMPLPAAFLPELKELHGRHCQPSIIGVPTRPYIDVFGHGVAMRDTTRNCCLQTGLGRASKTSTTRRYGSFFGQVTKPTNTTKVSLSATVQGGRSVLHSFV